MYNDVKDTSVRFSIGNGTGTYFYYNYTSYKPAKVQDAIAHNKSHQYAPTNELKWYLKINDKYELITEATTQEAYDQYLVYEYRCSGRSNAFQVAGDGRAQLIRKENHTALVDADILTKKEIEDKILEGTATCATKEDLSAYAKKTELPVIPTNISAFRNDVGYLTKHQDISHLATKGQVQTVESKIPTKTSQLTNDAGFLTKHQDLSAYAKRTEIPSVEGLATEGYVDNAFKLSNTNTKAYLDGSDISNHPNYGSIGAINASRVGPVGVLSLTCSNPSGDAMSITLDETFKPIGKTSIIVNRNFTKDGTGDYYSDTIIANLYSNNVGEKPSLWVPSKDGYTLEGIQIDNQLVMLKIN
jgi:hypothetical protein